YSTPCSARPAWPRMGRAPAEGVGRSGIDQQRSVDGVHRGVVIVRHEADYEAGGSECLRIVGTTLDRGPRVAERSLLVRLLHTAAHVAHLMAQSRCGLRRGVIRLERKGSVKQRERLIRPNRHIDASMRQGAQIEIVGVEVVRSLAFGPLDLGVKQARLDRTD